MAVLIAPPKTLTTEDLLDFPDDGIERYLIDGQLREVTGKPGEGPMTVRNSAHSTTESEIVYALRKWIDTLPEPRGKVASGEAGFILADRPQTTVGIDVAYVPHAIKTKKIKRRTLFLGPPILAVEIQSPSDESGRIREKVTTYLRHGVKVVWVVDPGYPIVAVHSKGQKIRFYQRGDTISDIPFLPGFACPVAEFFR
jgi:Uma2 family endonuclease